MKKAKVLFMTLAILLLIFTYFTLVSNPIAADTLPEDIPEDVFQEMEERLLEEVRDSSRLEVFYNYYFEKLAGYQADPPLIQFGYTMFERPGDFQAIPELTVGPDYVIGPGDVIKISVYGAHSFEEYLEVDRGGEVSIPEIGSVSLWGLEFGEAREVLTNLIENYYSGISVSVTMDELRSISVYVMGEVKRPGIKTMSSLSTVIHGLLEAEGPSKGGSLRDIRVIREDEVIAEMDLYDFLLEGRRKEDIRLNTGDTIFVPGVSDTFAIGGEVRNNAIFESEEEIRLSELIKMAGGFTSMASTDNIMVERVERGQDRSLKEISFELSLEEFSGSEADIYLENGDIVYVDSILAHRTPERSNYFTISGNVRHPGNYSFAPGTTIKEAVEKAGDILPETLMERAEIYRYISEETRETIEVDLEKALAGEEEHNIEIEEWDYINIYAEYDIYPEKLVEAAGEINEPGVFELTPGKTLRDLIFAAREPTEEAYLNRAEIFRQRDDKLREVIAVDLEKVLAGEKDIELKSGDILQVYANDWVFPEQVVEVEGAVQEPGSFELYQNMKLSDLLFATGGLEREAHRERIEIYRPNYGLDKTSEVIQVDFSELDYSLFEEAIYQTPVKDREELTESEREKLAELEARDIALQEGDRVFVRTHIDDREERIVRITGEVELPGEYAITRGETLNSLLDRAGGLTSLAFPFGAVLTREEIQEAQTRELEDYINYQQRIIEEEKAELMVLPLTREERERRKTALDHQEEALKLMEASMPEGRIIFDLEQALAEENSPHNLILAAEDEIHIPARPQVVILVGEVYNPESIIYEPDRELDYYLDRVGGVTGRGDEEAIHILRADGSVVTGAEEMNQIEEGDMIIVPPENHSEVIEAGDNHE